VSARAEDGCCNPGRHEVCPYGCKLRKKSRCYIYRIRAERFAMVFHHTTGDQDAPGELYHQAERRKGHAGQGRNVCPESHHERQNHREMDNEQRDGRNSGQQWQGHREGNRHGHHHRHRGGRQDGEVRCYRQGSAHERQAQQDHAIPQQGQIRNTEGHAQSKRRGELIAPTNKPSTSPHLNNWI